MRHILTSFRCLWLALFVLCGPAPAVAQDTYPSGPIRIVVPFGAGATADIVARVLGDLMSKELGTTFVIENKPGAGGTIGASIVANSPPDGYTLVLGTIASHGISTIMMQGVTYDPVKSFSPIMLVANVPNMLVVHKNIPVSAPAEFVAYGKQVGDINFASAGVGTTSELAGELMRIELGVPLTHVPYKSGSNALADVISGLIPAMIWQVAPLKPQIEAGTIKPIAALTAKRISSFPNVRTLAETLLPGFDSSAWFGILAPANTPAPRVQRLRDALVKAMSNESVEERLRGLALEPETLGPDEFRKVIADDLERWRKVLVAMKPKQ